MEAGGDVSLIIPFRDRAAHMRAWMLSTRDMLPESTKIIVVEQTDNKKLLSVQICLNHMIPVLDTVTQVLVRKCRVKSVI